MEDEVTSMMSIPSEREEIIVGKNGSILTKTQQDTGTTIILDEIDGSANKRITITGLNMLMPNSAFWSNFPQPRRKQSTLYNIYIHVPLLYYCFRFVYCSIVTELVESWSIEVSNNFHKATQTSLAIAKMSSGSSCVLIRGWDKKSVITAKSLLINKAEKFTSDYKRGDGTNSVFNIAVNNKVELTGGVTQLTKLLEPLTGTTKPSRRASYAHSSDDSRGEKSAPIPAEEPESMAVSDRRPLIVTDRECPLQTDEPKYPNCMNLLVLGETGVGKSTFINGLVNYLKYGSMDEALEGGVEILIKSHFTLTDDNFATRDIITEVTMPDEQGPTINEMFGQGQSATQDPKSYMFSWMDGSDPKAIRIIDTPGIGDTRGIDQDKKNFDKILSFIADFSELHAVCILIKPNTARLTLAFRFCIDELLVHLHKSASENIVFCFTNTRGTLYKPGDTLPTLREHLSKLETHRGIHIPLNKSTLFSFDNESFRFLCACKEDFPFSSTEKANFSGSWDKSVEESRRLFDRVTELPVHNVNDTLCLNNTRSVIITLARPLAEIARNQMINMRLIEDKMKEVEKHAEEGTILRGNLYVDQIVIHAEELPFPQTVCTSASCVTHMRFNTSANSPMQTVYKTICHDHCFLPGVQTENCPNTALQQCEAMDPYTLNCQICNCIWSTHMHIRYKLNQSMQKVIDPTVEESIKNKDDVITTIRLFLTKERQKVDQLKAESDKITAYCAEFAAFLKQNSILPYNDSYRQYIEHLIREEREKVSAGGPEDLLGEMEQYKAEYEQQVNLLDSSMNQTGVTARSVNEMNAMITELQNLQHCGSVLTEIKKLEMMSVRQKQAHMSKKIQVDGFFKKMKRRAKKWTLYK